jgi:magnesium-transporting ATPase (P-type)
VSVLLYHLYEPQYAVNWEIIVGLFVSAVIVEFVCRWVGLAGRRTAIQGNSHSYRTYQYQNHLAQWESKEGNKLVPGTIYKVGDGEHIPADSLLLHCE